MTHELIVGESTMIERIGLTPRWCEAAIAGNFVFIAGHTAATTKGLPLSAQTSEVLSLLDETLENSGTSRKNLLFAQIYLKDIAKIDEMNVIWDAWVAPSSAPARATVEARLAATEYEIEITAIAWREQ